MVHRPRVAGEPHAIRAAVMIAGRSPDHRSGAAAFVRAFRGGGALTLLKSWTALCGWPKEQRFSREGRLRENYPSPDSGPVYYMHEHAISAGHRSRCARTDLVRRPDLCARWHVGLLAGLGVPGSIRCFNISLYDLPCDL